MFATTNRRSPTSLRPYQQQAITHLFERNAALLGLRMGGGKTVCSMTAAVELLDAGEIENVLVVAPKAVALNTWGSEYDEWEHTADLDVGVCLGTAGVRAAVLGRGHTVTVVTYDNLQWLATAVPKRTWDLIILDEITRFNRAGKRFRAFYPFLQRATIRWGLTGSLAANNLEHVFYPIKSLDLGQTLGQTITAFRQQYFIPENFGWSARPSAPGQVAAKIKHLVYQPDPAVYQSQLPEVVYQVHEFDLDDSSTEVYQDLQNEFMAEVGDAEITVASAGVLVSKLAQAASGFVYDEDKVAVHMSDDRLSVLRELIAEAGEPVLVWYWFNETGERLRRLGYVDLIGNLDAWNRGEVPVAICNPASGGHGINAQAGGSRMVWLEHTYSNELREQAIARLHRQGQQSTVFVHDIVAMVDSKRGIDDAILRSQKGKRATAVAVCNQLKNEVSS